MLDRKLHVFFCHSSQDKPTVRELCQQFTDDESWIDLWLDEKRLLPGEDWQTSIKEAVESTDLVIICLSNNSVSKEGFIQKELSYARDRAFEKPEGSIFLIPVRLDDCEVPKGLRSIQWTDYFGENKKQSYIALLEIFRKKHQQVLHREDEFAPSKNNTLPQKDPQPILSVLSDYYDQIDDFAARSNTTYGVPTGFIDFDRFTNGLKPSKLLVIASRANEHKTNFLLSILRNAALTYKKNIAVFHPLGMTNNEMVQHLITQETGIDSYRLSIGKLAENELPIFTHAIEVMSDIHIFLDDSTTLSFRHIKEKSRQLVQEGQIDLIVVDNIHFISKEENAENPTKDLNYINLKILAHELNVPVLAGVQLPGNAERRFNKRPQLSDLHKFGQLEDLADAIIFIHHPNLYELDFDRTNIAEIIIAKHNSGPIGSIDLLYRSNLSRYENAATKVFRPNE